MHVFSPFVSTCSYDLKIQLNRFGLLLTWTESVGARNAKKRADVRAEEEESRSVDQKKDFVVYVDIY